MTYENLNAATKATWTAVNTALTNLFIDDAERETLLADVASFRRGNRSLLEYKTELTRLMDTHLPDLRAISSEYNRQIVFRFVEGLNDDDLKQELRRHCRRANNNIDAAYNYAVDWEATETTTRAREHQDSSTTFAAFEIGEDDAVANYDSPGTIVRRLQSIASRQESREQQIIELYQHDADMNNRIDQLSNGIHR